MNYIGPSIVIKGDVTAGEDLTVAGRVDGNIRLEAGELTLAPHSEVVGELLAPLIVVHGALRGTLEATVRAEVRAQAAVTGKVAAPILVVADGALLNGRVEVPAAARPRAVEHVPALKLAVAV